MRQKLLLVCSLAAVVLVLGVVRRAGAPARRLAHELRQLEESPAWRASVPAPCADRLQTELREASELLEARLADAGPRAREVLRLLDDGGALADRGESPEFLEEAGAFLEQIERALSDSEVQAAMSAGERLAVDHPLLLEARGQGDVLCAAAVLAALDGRGERAARLLALALDFAYAVDDHALISAMVRTALEARVGEQVHRLLDLGLVDPLQLRQALEPRLLRTFDEDYRIELVRREFQVAVEFAREAGALHPGSGADNGELLRMVLLRDEVLALARLAPEEFSKGRGARPAGESLSVWPTALEVLHEHVAREAVLCEALGLVAHPQE